MNAVARVRHDGIDFWQREPCWTDSLAVGGNGFVERIQSLILSRQETEIKETAEDLWVLKEESYRQKAGPKIGCKALK